MTLKLGLKLGLKPNSFAKTEIKTEVKTELQFLTKVNLNNLFLNQTCATHLDR